MGKRSYIIAEAGINHGGDSEVAQRMISAAAAAGADAIKFQSFSADGLTHQQLAADQHEFFRRFELSEAEHRMLADACRAAGIDFLSTPFDFRMADMLKELDVPAFKIASCDLTNLPLIRHVAASGKPVFISTGMGSLKEARAAAEAASAAGASRVVLLQCTTNYPTAYPDVHLRALSTLASRSGFEAGFSDHSIGNYCCFAAAALGAAVLEKHFCLDKSAPGPDIACSCDPQELSDLVRGVRAIEAALGDGEKRMLDSEKEVAWIARRSIFYSADLPVGHVITPADLSFLRPGIGMSPARVEELLGRALRREVRAGEPADPGHIGG